MLFRHADQLTVLVCRTVSSEATASTVITTRMYVIVMRSLMSVGYWNSCESTEPNSM